MTQFDYIKCPITNEPSMNSVDSDPSHESLTKLCRILTTKEDKLGKSKNGLIKQKWITKSKCGLTNMQYRMNSVDSDAARVIHLPTWCHDILPLL